MTSPATRRTLEDPDDATPNRQVDEERVALLYGNAPVALATVVVNGAILIAFLSFQVHARALFVWGASLLAVTLGRTILLRAYRRAPEARTSVGWENAFAVGALANGLAWGFGTAAFLDTSLEYRVGVLFFIGGMIAGASSSSATSLKSFAAYTVPASLPPLAALVLEASAENGVLALTSLVFITAMSLMARRGGRVIVDSIRLRLQNEALARELTERSRERAGRLQELLDHAGVITLVADPMTSVIIDASKNVDTLFGVSARTLVGQPLVGGADLPPFASDEAWSRMIAEARAGLSTVNATMRAPLSTVAGARTGAVKTRHVELTATVREVLTTPYLLIVLKDVTERRQLESQLTQAHLLASVGTLSAGVAHEVNNPLASVLTNLRLLQAVLLDTPPSGSELSPRELVDDAIAGAERIRTTVTNLLTTTRTPLDGQPESDPRQIVEMLLKIANTEIRHRAEVVIDAEPTPAVRADPLRLYQVLLPIILQATQAIADGDATRNRIAVRVRHDRDDDMVRIEVEDSGAALSEGEAASVFEPFSATRPNARGAGLALSVSKNVALELNGTVDASVSGAGTRFTVRLPAAARGHETDGPEPDARPGLDVQCPLRLLVVDDDPIVGRALARLLKPHEVVVQTEARDALALMTSSEPFDGILCDVMMPDMSGMDFYEAVSALRPDWARRIVFMTGGAFTEGATTFLSDIDNPCLVKPFERTAVDDALRTVRGR